MSQTPPSKTDNIPDRIRLAALHLQRGDLQAAQETVAEILAQSPTERDAHLLLTGILVQRGEDMQALAALLEGEKNHPADPAFPHMLGQLLRDVGRPAEALAAYRRATLLPAATAAMFREAGRIFEAMGDLRQAALVYDKAAALEPAAPQNRADAERLRNLIHSAERRLAKHLEFFEAGERHPVPYFGFAPKPFHPHQKGTRFDAWGFPNPSPPPLIKPEGEIRVFILGDSTMAGGEDGIGSSVPARARDILHNRGRADVSVYNFGLTSSCSMQMLALLIFKLADYQPDLVVFNCGATDVFNPITYDPRPGYPYNFYVIEELYSRFFDFERNQASDPDTIFGYADLIRDLAGRQAGLRAQIGIGESQEWESQVASNFGDFLTRLDKISAGFGFKSCVMLQPLIHAKAALTPEESDFCSQRTRDYFSRQYARYRQMMFPDGDERGLWGKNVALYDVSNIFAQRSETLYTDFIHYNRTGKALMAERVADVIEDQLMRIRVSG